MSRKIIIVNPGTALQSSSFSSSPLPKKASIAKCTRSTSSVMLPVEYCFKIALVSVALFVIKKLKAKLQIGTYSHHLALHASLLAARAGLIVVSRTFLQKH